MFLHTKAKIKRPEQDPTFGLLDEQDLPPTRLYVGIDRAGAGLWSTRVGLVESDQEDIDRRVLFWERTDIPTDLLDTVLMEELTGLARGCSGVCLVMDQPNVAHWLRRARGRSEEEDREGRGLGAFLRDLVPGERALLLDQKKIKMRK